LQLRSDYLQIIRNCIDRCKSFALGFRSFDTGGAA
jgi:hypothetical protein